MTPGGPSSFLSGFISLHYKYGQPCIEQITYDGLTLQQSKSILDHIARLVAIVPLYRFYARMERTHSLKHTCAVHLQEGR